MRRFLCRIVLAALPLCLCPAGPAFAQAPQQPGATLVIAAGTAVPLAVTRPVWAATAKPGDTLYAITSQDVALNGQTVIPAGTYVEATIEGLVKPTNKVQQALFALQFDKLVFANGYTITLSGTPDTHGAKTLATVTVSVTPANDLLLDNGTQFSLSLQTPLTLQAAEVAQAVPLSHAPVAAEFVPATLCRFIPGSPGTDPTPDTVIPGTPGTPDTVIPGVDGAPDTVIPGIPATPSTTIPGSPGTPASDPVYCPDPPKVVSSVPGIVAPTQTPSQR
jgi:uncharacterized Zn-binding protein involved in type VI secretion